MLVLKDAPKKEHVTQAGSALALMPSENSVDNEPMKVPKGGVTN